ncbi:hypothetical protein CRN61_13395 [Vibrio vulnificus]|uniref:hypothetical protein n=1 Tax=Vibrio TaxID=662 RepID=UPI000C9E4C21|nr:hypothetical protein [Vibrio vulnificus]PNG62453.1 hypothetical protein SC81_21715 [Vibrio vulnificus]POC78896.1 hypothetical protein CRN61_13395 [Vibrio vulnificus]HCH5895033.1 hypothetical protein [Vibrio parahaemolyticus]
MSLVNKKSGKSGEREAMSSPHEILDQIKQKTQATQKKHREKYLADWKAEKAKIDGMTPEELSAYIESTEGNAFEPRVGLHSMKINPHEHAVIKLAMEMTGARSSRELFVKHCKDVINNSK